MFLLVGSQPYLVSPSLLEHNQKDIGGTKVKTWTKPAASTIDAGFEVTRYLPSTLDVAAKRRCTK
jgi:coenzyme PQQ precursor peptide PqqA